MFKSILKVYCIPARGVIGASWNPEEKFEERAVHHLDQQTMKIWRWNLFSSCCDTTKDNRYLKIISQWYPPTHNLNHKLPCRNISIDLICTFCSFEESFCLWKESILLFINMWDAAGFDAFACETILQHYLLVSLHNL